MSKIFNILILALIFFSGLIFGLSLSYKDDTNVVERAKRTVLGYVDYPKLESFKDVKYYFNKISHNRGEVGYVCGYVSQHYETTNEYAKFIVKVYTKPDGTINMSIPVIKGVEHLFNELQVNTLWKMYCRLPSEKNN